MSTAPGKSGGDLQGSVEAAKADLGGQADAAAAKVGDAAAKLRGLKDDATDLTGIASSLAGNAVEHGRTLIDAARGQATTFADQRKNDAAQSIADIAASLRETGTTFDGRPNIQQFVGSAAQGLDDLASTIRDRSFAELYGEAESFARRQPAVVALGALAAGFALARFIKSTSEDIAHAASRTAPATRGRSSGTEL